MTVTSYRVSAFEQFVVVIDFPSTRHPRRWALWDLSGPSGVVLEDGTGDPPARHFPLGIVPAAGRAEGE